MPVLEICGESPDKAKLLVVKIAISAVFVFEVMKYFPSAETASPRGFTSTDRVERGQAKHADGAVFLGHIGNIGRHRDLSIHQIPAGTMTTSNARGHQIDALRKVMGSFL